jgi:hypothetical protein
MLLKPKKKGLFLATATPFYKATGGGVVFSLTNTDSAVDNSNATTITYSGKSFGAADPNRIIIVALGARTTNTALTSVTIGGVTATEVSGSAAINTNTTLCDIYQAAVPTGTTGNIVIVGPAALVRSGIGVFRLVTATPAATSASNNESLSAASIAASVTVPATGKGIAFQMNRDTVAPATWTNATSDFGLAITGGSGAVTGADVTGTGAVTVTAAAASGEVCLSIAAWGP